MNRILFYKTKDRPYGCFSNFSRHPVRVYDREWPTSEHAFQAMKFHPHRPDLVNMVHGAPGPMLAATFGRDRSFPMRADWEQGASPEVQANTFIDDGVSPGPAIERVKDYIMYEVVKAKFNQEGLKSILLGTGDLPIIEDSNVDPYWGWGSSRTGLNKLGKILMLVRQQLREEASQAA